MCVSASLSHITFVTAHCESIRAVFECRWVVSINQQRWLIKYATCHMLHATCHMQLALFAKFATFVLSHCLLAHIPMAQWVNLLCNSWGYVCLCVCVCLWGSCCIDVWVCVCGHVHDPSLLGAWQFEMPRCRAIMASWPLPRPLTTEAAHQPPCGSSINAATPALTLMQQNWSRCKWKRPWGDADAAAAAVAAAAATAAVAIYIQTNQHTHTHTYAQRVHMSSFTYASV